MYKRQGLILPIVRYAVPLPRAEFDAACARGNWIAARWLWGRVAWFISHGWNLHHCMRHASIAKKFDMLLEMMNVTPNDIPTLVHSRELVRWICAGDSHPDVCFRLLAGCIRASSDPVMLHWTLDRIAHKYENMGVVLAYGLITSQGLAPLHLVVAALDWCAKRHQKIDAHDAWELIKEAKIVGDIKTARWIKAKCAELIQLGRSLYI